MRRVIVMMMVLIMLVLVVAQDDNPPPSQQPHRRLCALKCAAKCFLKERKKGLQYLLCFDLCMLKCMIFPSDVLYNCTSTCAQSMPTSFDPGIYILEKFYGVPISFITFVIIFLIFFVKKYFCKIC
jgi:hypothetical protein